ncbi:hypothetical protein BFX12_04130 [Vibrio cholerae]|uniref:hypothetical protein n=1 Tax=Vibrio cholerae TaxID=666 RepID=UPI00053BD484|nr:hypothetical protein [Vibrio cholerae]KNA45716.1 hypothetical protein A5A_023793 [Vibrio cholerae MZO-2]OEC18536.1 hypothetical protein BFX12_04130 [Vibrio cholerae]
MKIECPHCQTDNDIEFAENIACKECKKNFKGFKFSKRKLVSASTALLVGAIGGYKVNSALDEERYPLEVEYAIVDTCVNSSKNMVSISRYANKRETCLCALAQTEKSVPYSDYKSDPQLFLSKFKLNAKGCS